MYKIEYNSNPNLPIERNHVGNLNQMLLEDSREFNSFDEAVDFWFQCSSPITELKEFYPEFKKRFPDMKKEKLIKMLNICDERIEQENVFAS